MSSGLFLLFSWNLQPDRTQLFVSRLRLFVITMCYLSIIFDLPSHLDIFLKTGYDTSIIGCSLLTSTLSNINCILIRQTGVGKLLPGGFPFAKSSFRPRHCVSSVHQYLQGHFHGGTALRSPSSAVEVRPMVMSANLDVFRYIEGH
jgi:hypothetical protein